jgi:hypothetical protein
MTTNYYFFYYFNDFMFVNLNVNLYSFIFKSNLINVFFNVFFKKNRESSFFYLIKKINKWYFNYIQIFFKIKFKKYKKKYDFLAGILFATCIYVCFVQLNFF